MIQKQTMHNLNNAFHVGLYLKMPEAYDIVYVGRNEICVSKFIPSEKPESGFSLAFLLSFIVGLN